MDAIVVVQSSRINPVSLYSLIRSPIEFTNTATTKDFKRLSYNMNERRVIFGCHSDIWIVFHWFSPEVSLEIQFDICIRQLLEAAADDIYTFIETKKNLLLMLGRFQFILILTSGLTLVVSRLSEGDDIFVTKLQTGITVLSAGIFVNPDHISDDVSSMVVDVMKIKAVDFRSLRALWETMDWKNFNREMKYELVVMLCTSDKTAVITVIDQPAVNKFAGGKAKAIKSSRQKPKGYISAFNFFLQKMRNDRSLTKSKRTNNELNCKLGKAWKKLADSERIQYMEMADLDKVRYLREVAEYNSCSDSHSAITARINPPDGYDMEGLPLSDIAGTMVHTVKKPVERPLSKYNHYARQDKQFIAKVSEGLGVNMQHRVGKLLSARWKAMDPKEKILYVELEKSKSS